MCNSNAIGSYPHEWCNRSRCCFLRQKSYAHRMASHTDSFSKNGQMSSKCPETISNNASTKQKTTKCYCRETRTLTALPIKVDGLSNSKESNAMKCTNICTESIVPKSSESVDIKIVNEREMQLKSIASNAASSEPALTPTAPSENLVEDAVNIGSLSSRLTGLSEERVEPITSMRCMSAPPKYLTNGSGGITSRMGSKTSGLTTPNGEVVEVGSKNGSKMSGLTANSKKGSTKWSGLTAPNAEIFSISRMQSKTSERVESTKGSVGVASRMGSKSSDHTTLNGELVKGASYYVTATEGLIEINSQIGSKITALRALGEKTEKIDSVIWCRSTPTKVCNGKIVEPAAETFSCLSSLKGSTKGPAGTASRTYSQSTPLRIPKERRADTSSANGCSLFPSTNSNRESAEVNSKSGCETLPLSNRCFCSASHKDRLETSDKNTKTNEKPLFNTRSNALESMRRSSRKPPAMATQNPIKTINNNNNKPTASGNNLKLFEDLKRYLNKKRFCGFPFNSNSLKQPQISKEIKQKQNKSKTEQLEKIKPKAKPRKPKRKAPQSPPPSVPTAGPPVKPGPMTDMCFDCNVPIRVCIPISKCIENFCSMSTKFLATSDITMPQRDQCAGALVKAADHMSSPAPSIESACKLCITLCPVGCCPVITPLGGTTPATPPLAAADSSPDPSNLPKKDSKQQKSTVSENASKKKRKAKKPTELPRQPKELPRQPKELPKQPNELRRQPKEFARQPKEFSTQYGICSYCRKAPQKNLNYWNSDNDENMSSILDLKKTADRTPPNSVVTLEPKIKSQEMIQSDNSNLDNNNKKFNWPIPVPATLSKKTNKKQHKTISSSYTEEESSHITLSEEKIAINRELLASKQIAEPSCGGPQINITSSEQMANPSCCAAHIKLSSCEQITDPSFGEPQTRRSLSKLSQEKPENKSLSSFQGSQESSIKSEALKELLTSIKEPIINNVDVNDKSKTNEDDTNNQKQSEESEKLFAQLVRRCNSQCEKTFLATQEILKCIKDVGNSRIVDTDNSKNSIHGERKKEHNADRSSVDKSVKSMSQMPQQCHSSCQTNDEVDLYSVNSDCRKCHLVKNSLNLKLSRLKQENSEDPPTLVEYNVEAITRCPSKADVDSKASLMCDLQDLNESNIEEMMEDMKKCCNQTQSNSKLPLLLLPFPLNGGTDEGMGTICQPDEWQEIDESQLPNILNSVSQRPSEGFDNSSQSPEVDKSGVIKPNEASIEVDKEIGFQTSLNAGEARAKAAQDSVKYESTMGTGSKEVINQIGSTEVDKVNDFQADQASVMYESTITIGSTEVDKESDFQMSLSAREALEKSDQASDKFESTINTNSKDVTNQMGSQNSSAMTNCCISCQKFPMNRCLDNFQNTRDSYSQTEDRQEIQSQNGRYASKVPEKRELLPNKPVYGDVERRSNQRKPLDERDNQRNQAVAKDKDVVVLMKMRKMRRTSRGVADINELKSNKKPDAVDRRERPQMLQQEQPPRRLPQEQQMQAQPYQRSNGYATLDQYYQQLRADYEPQQQCFSSWRVMPQPVHPPDTQRSGAARNITESFYQHTLSKYGVPCMPRHFSNSNCD